MCRELLVKFTNPDLCALTEQVIFQDPYYSAPLNRWTSPQLDAAAADLRGDVAAKAAAFKLKQKFCQNAEALIHGDLHTGSIMVRPGPRHMCGPLLGHMCRVLWLKGFMSTHVLAGLHAYSCTDCMAGNRGYGGCRVCQFVRSPCTTRPCCTLTSQSVT